MSKHAWKPYVLWVLLSEAVGALAGWLVQDSVWIYKTALVRPPLSPPAIVFPIVWTVLYALMGIGAARIFLAPASPEREQSLRLFGAQLFFNFLWSVIFFHFQAFGLALVWLAALWGLLFWMIQSFRRVDTLAAKLQWPYLLWTTFAAYLNLGVWLLNR